jgi:trk system potassium uptake protein TrkA
VIWPEDVIARYNTEVFKRDMAGSMAAAVSQDAPSELFPATGDTVVAEVMVPPDFFGKTIRELNIRQAYGATVLMVKRTSSEGREDVMTSIDPDRAFQSGDVMLVLGSDKALRRLKLGLPRSR